MNTHSHAFFTYAALQGHPQAGWAVLGSAFPDLLFFLACPVNAALKGIGLKAAHHSTHQNKVLHTLVESCHSFLFLALVSALFYLVFPQGLMFCWGWLSHLMIDFFTHHQSGHPPLFPLHRWKFKSPISFYEPAQHGYPFMAIEHLSILVITSLWLLKGGFQPSLLVRFLDAWQFPLLCALSLLLSLALIALFRQREPLPS
ncbi:MAG TPA: hypothetical protein V6C82_02730 [Chroococcales cyanobacterium]